MLFCKKNLFLATAVMVMTGGFVLPSLAQYQDGGNVAKGSHMTVPFFYKANFQTALDAGNVETFRLKEKAAMKEFYEKRENDPLWTGSRRKDANAEDVLEILEDSWTHGLNPENYHVETLRELAGASLGDKRARFELLMTDAVIRYGEDMTGMRIDPSAVKLKAKYFRQPLEPAEVLERVAMAKNPVDGVESLAPQEKQYEALRRELVRLSSESNEYDDVLPMNFGGGLFQPGSHHKEVYKIRKRLGVEHRNGDGPENYYDDRTAAAVMKFQSEFGLEPDGIIGPQTLDKLNQTHRAKMEQIVANLERMRWMPEEMPDTYVAINIGSQTLKAVENGRTAFDMDVVVGMPWRQTKQFSTEIRGVRFNPTWTVPMGIKMKDFLPKLQENPDYLSDKKFDIYKGYGKDRISVDPVSVDWSAVGWQEMSKLRLVQAAGDYNALGYVRILMDSDYDIYMHDTNHPEFFEKTQRTYSSGCIRLKEPEKMAQFILRHNKDWSDDQMAALIEAGDTVDIPAAKRIPVFVMYQTVWLDDNGNLVYGADVYDQDKKLVETLAAMNGFHLTDNGESRMADARPDRRTYNR